MKLYRIKKSKIDNNGRGLYATKDIKAGTKIINYIGKIITNKEVDRSDKFDNGKPIYLFTLNKRYTLDGDFSWNTAGLINHSCNNNCDYEGKGLKIWVTSIKDIKKGDGRFIDKYVDLEVSLGDYVFSNGDLASIVFIDVLARMIPSVIGKEESVKEDSFFNGLLKGPSYTRPEVYDGMSVPDILLSGNHEEIKAWREYQSIKTTLEKRPEIFDKIKLTKKQKKLLEELDSKRIL